jgi:uncharacterized protein (TIGR02118 family)
MIKVSVMYPNQRGSHFDMSYYCAKHIPLVRELLGAALMNVAVDEGIGGMDPGSPAPYHAVGHLSFESVGAFQAVFAQHAARILGDIPNYTNAAPTVQISNVKI